LTVSVRAVRNWFRSNGDSSGDFFAAIKLSQESAGNGHKFEGNFYDCIGLMQWVF
jgi:hypothetical protein